MSKTTIYLVRHCEYENKKGIIPYHLSGFPLTENGKIQAKKLAKRFSKQSIAAIYSSPILRAKQTAEIINDSLGLEIKFSKKLMDTKTPFQGMPVDKFNNLFSKGIRVLNHPSHLSNGGETINQLFTRIISVIKRAKKLHAHKSVLIVSHQDPIMVAVHGLLDKNFQSFFKKTRPDIQQGEVFKLIL